jgi:hypothetical protein
MNEGRTQPVASSVPATSSDMQARLQNVEQELARTRRERDHALRLLRQQITVSSTRIQNETFAFYMEQNKFTVRLLRRIPRGLKDKLPLGFKQAVRNILVKMR